MWYDKWLQELTEDLLQLLDLQAFICQKCLLQHHPKFPLDQLVPSMSPVLVQRGCPKYHLVLRTNAWIDPSRRAISLIHLSTTLHQASTFHAQSPMSPPT
jgi:hypothetical protein